MSVFDILSFLNNFILLIVAMTVHEFSHGWVAYKLGDNTAKFQGRLTLNPLAHIDPVGTIIMPLMLFFATQGRFVFGAAKPVPINYWALKNPKRDMILIGLSGPFSNFIFALILSFIVRFSPYGWLAPLIYKLILINVILGVFNLIPVPPLDGSRVLHGLLPYRLAEKYAMIEPYGFFIVIAFSWVGLLDLVIWPLVMLVLTILSVPLSI
jgi:Zn-dependent protease